MDTIALLRNSEWLTVSNALEKSIKMPIVCKSLSRHVYKFLVALMRAWEVECELMNTNWFSLKISKYAYYLAWTTFSKILENWLARHSTSIARNTFKGPLFFFKHLPSIECRYTTKTSACKMSKNFKSCVKYFVLVPKPQGNEGEWEGLNTPLLILIPPTRAE